MKQSLKGAMRVAAVVGAVRERPMLFSPERVEGILDGRKTQTQRVATKINPDYLDAHCLPTRSRDWRVNREALARMSSPFGQPGERLWVRETWQTLALDYDYESGYCDGYHAVAPERVRSFLESERAELGGSKPYAVVYEAKGNWDSHRDDRGFPWRPSIHMPRWACRLVLEITDIRIHQLCETTEEQARAEGYEDRAAFLNCDFAKPLAPTTWVWAITFRPLNHASRS